MKAMRSVHDLIEEGKIRALWWALCIFAISYFLSHTSKSMWMNIPISVLIGLALHIVTNEVEFHWKVQPNRKQSYLSYLEKKQLSVNDSHLSAMPPPSKWKRKIDSPLVQAAVEEFIDKIVQDFVLDLWYSLITPDKEAPELIRGIILDALGEVAGRVKEVNLVDLLTRDIVDLIGDHIELFRRNQAAIGADIMVTLSSDERNERLTHQLMASKELHPALISSDSDYKFLQQLMSGLLAVVLRQREAQVPLGRCTAREILTCLILQPILNLVSPVHINELIEYILLSAKDILIRMDEIGLPHKEYDNDSLAARNVESGGDSTFRKHEIFHGQETDSTVVEMEKHGEKVGHASKGPSSNTSLAEPMQPRVAEWAQILDAATQRRTEVLAPENLENMWTIGRHYKDKINKDTKGLQMPLASDTIKNNAISVMESRKEILTTNPKTSLGTASICHSPRKGHIPQVETSCNSGKKLSGDVDREATSHGASGPSYGPKDVNIVANDGNKTRLKGSRNTSDLRVELVEKDANTCESQELLLEDYHSPDSERYCGEHEFKSLSPLKIHAEGLHFPKLTCRVMGAFFEKIGSKSFAVYAIAVTDAQINTWFVERRYRNFERLHRNLKDIPNYTLHLPPKRIFSSSTEDAFVHQRCIELDKYLRDLLSIPNVAEQHEVWDFLCASSKNYSFGKSPSVMKTLAVNVDDAVDDIVCQFKGVSDGFIHKVVGSSSTLPSMPVRNLSWHADDLPRHTSMPSPLKTTNSISDDEEGDKDHSHDHSTPANEWHSDNELNSKSFSRRVVKRFEDSGTTNPENQLVSEMKSECKHAGGVASLPVVSSIVEDPVEVPPEWIPPNVTVPVLNLVDKVFQLNKRGWIRRQVFWISKQILQLMMEDAIDDFLLRQIHWLRRDDVVAQGIRWLQDILWPEGKFFLDLEITGRISDLRQSDAASSRGSSRKTLRKSFPPDSFEAQLEAARRANDIKKMLFNGAPIALVSLVGHKQYRRCARDIFYFTQSSICIKQLAYGVLELLLISIFPELRDVVVDIHRKMRAQR